MADQAYCMKCRDKREFEGTLVTLANGRPALQGTLPRVRHEAHEDHGHGRREGDGLVAAGVRHRLS